MEAQAGGCVMPRLRSKLMGTVYMHGIKWDIYAVAPNSKYLKDEKGEPCFAMTRHIIQKMYLNRELTLDRMRVAFSHELVHVIHDEVRYPIKDVESHATQIEYPMRDLLMQNPMTIIDKYFSKIK